MTMTDEEKAEARATDPRAARDHRPLRRDVAARTCSGCTASSATRSGPPASRRRPPDPARDVDPDDGEPWWDPAADAAVAPGDRRRASSTASRSAGAAWSGSTPPRADAQDLFFADQVARVTAVLSDVDGGTHVAVVLVDDPAADLHEWYGRYLYFAPDELEPLDPSAANHRGEPTMRVIGKLIARA